MNFPQFKFAQKSNNTGPRMGTYTYMPAVHCSTPCRMTSFWFLPSFILLCIVCPLLLNTRALCVGIELFVSKRRSKRNFKPFRRQQINFNLNITLWQIWHSWSTQETLYIYFKNKFLNPQVRTPESTRKKRKNYLQIINFKQLNTTNKNVARKIKSIPQ